MIIVVSGPKACGKTRNAERLKDHFQIDTVIDDWTYQDRRTLPDRALILTYESSHDRIRRAIAPRRCAVLNYADIAFELGLPK